MTASKRCVVFSFQFVGLGTRKTGVIFWAEALARKGFDTHVVTVQLSWLSRLAGVSRLKHVPNGDFNRWRERGPRLKGFVWLPAVHPGRLPSVIPAWLSAGLINLYARLLPRSVVEVVRKADVVIIESCVAVALFERLKSIAPHARFMYCASDRLDAVGMNPQLTELLARTASRYDLIRIPAASMKADFPDDARVALLRHGIEKTLFDDQTPIVYRPGTVNAVIAGDMNFDRAAVERLIDHFPGVDFHTFGRMSLGAAGARPNVHQHGEVPFTEIVPYLKDAQVGIAPYRDRPGLEYLAESSLKLIQYTYCRLPTVAPEFARGGRSHVLGYNPDDPESVVTAMHAALAFDRHTIDTGGIDTWDDLVERSLQFMGIGKSRGDISSTSLPDVQQRIG